MHRERRAGWVIGGEDAVWETHSEAGVNWLYGKSQIRVRGTSPTMRISPRWTVVAQPGQEGIGKTELEKRDRMPRPRKLVLRNHEAG
jgi:hypothetical protein